MINVWIARLIESTLFPSMFQWRPFFIWWSSSDNTGSIILGICITTSTIASATYFFFFVACYHAITFPSTTISTSIASYSDIMCTFIITGSSFRAISSRLLTSLSPYEYPSSWWHAQSPSSYRWNGSVSTISGSPYLAFFFHTWAIFIYSSRL